MMRPRFGRIFALVCTLLAPFFPLLPVTAEEPAVLIISIDGLRPDAMLRAEAPSIRSLMRQGSFTFFARTTDLAITLPSHTSMLTGVPPDRHGVTWNDDRNPGTPPFPAAPTIFDIARAHGRTTAMAAGKSKLGSLAKPGSLSWRYVADQRMAADDEVTTEAVRMIREHRPDLVFVHLPDVDRTGHQDGWGSGAQLAAIGVADRCVGKIVASFDAANTGRHAYVLLSTDHGGSAKAHGAGSIESALTPFIIRGPGIRPDFDLTLASAQVAIEDVFATAIELLKLPQPEGIRGKVVREAFDGKSELLAD